MFSSKKKLAKPKPSVKKNSKNKPSKLSPVDSKSKPTDGKALTFGQVNIQNSSNRQNDPEPPSNSQVASYDWIPVKNPKMSEDTNAERSNSFDGLDKLTTSMRSQGTSLDDLSFVSSSKSEVLSLDSQVCFLFIKPHCHGIKGIEKSIIEMLKAAGVTVLDKGLITSKSIIANDHVDTHYAALSSRAIIVEPRDSAVPAAGQAEFQMTFGMSWATAIDEGCVFNASDAATFIGVDGSRLGVLWGELKPKDVIKFGRGFYCGRMQTLNNEIIFVVNGFYLSLREAYCSSSKLCWLSVKIPQSLSWEKFRAQVIGSADDPTTCALGSIRKTLHSKHASCSQSVEEDFIHASASPLEALFERMNWMGVKAETDHFGSQLLSAGLTVETLEKWRADPEVFFEGANQSVFELHEGLDPQACINRAVAVSASEEKSLALLRRRSRV